MFIKSGIVTSFKKVYSVRKTKTFAAIMSEALEKLEEEKIANNSSDKKKEKLSIRQQMRKRKWIDNNDDSSKRQSLEPTAERIRRKKTAILLGYSGANYYGMQRNPGMKTIEEELLKAMLKHKWVTEDTFEQSQNGSFQRAARTDKGVSAARQICSIKLPDNLDIGGLNADLPEQIRIFGSKRVTRGFNAKDQCSGRTYTYTLPTVAFVDHTSEQNFETNRIDCEKIKKVNEVLAKFEGTKNFHNFTSRKNYLDPSAKRYIISFSCSEPFVSPQGVEFVTIKVKGQSFMLHQIRKMIGLTVAVVRGNTTTKTIERAFTEERLDLPKAPGLGLVLDTVHYERYNDRYGTDGIHKPLTWTEEEDEIQAFIEKYIYADIFETECREKPFVIWMETLAKHSYDLRQTDSKREETREKVEGGGDDDEE